MIGKVGRGLNPKVCSNMDDYVLMTWASWGFCFIIAAKIVSQTTGRRQIVYPFHNQTSKMACISSSQNNYTQPRIYE